MTIANTVRKAGPFTCNAVTTVFPFTFKVFGNSDVVVSLTDSFGVITTLTLTSSYTVALNANQDVSPGGTVTTLIAYAAGYLITLTSGVAATQQVVLTNTGGFYPDVINAELDRLTILIQQQQEVASRSLVFPISDTLNAALPPVAQRTGKFLTFDAFGVPIVASGVGSDAAMRTDLAAYTGSSLIGFIQSGVSGIIRTIQSKLRDLISVKDYGVVGDAVTNDTAAFTVSITAAVPAGALLLTSPTYVGATRPSLKGVQLLGNKPVVYDRGGVLGKSVVNRRGRDLGQKVLGRAYLFRFWVYLAQFGVTYNATVKMYGDSVTAGYVGPLLQSFFAGVAGIGTVTNNAVSGTTIEQWRTGTGGFAASGKALSDWIAAPTDLLYIAFGINTPYYGNSPTDFVTSLDAALATIRASRDVTATSIIVVLPLASRDGGAMSIEGGWKRDEYFVYSLRELCEPLVDKYGICLFDPTVAMPEADVDVSGLNVNNWLDNTGVHPQFGNKYFVAGEIFDVLCPTSMRSALASSTDATLTITPAAGFTLPGAENMRTIKRRDLVVTDGYVNMTTPAPLTVGQTIAVIGATVNPAVFIRRVDLVLYNGSWETIRGEIDNTVLRINAGQVSVMSPTRVYVIGQWSTT